MQRFRHRQINGFTLTEFLIILALIAFLALILLFGFSRQQGRARDARRKADLEKIRIAFEDYYNDKGCYPPPGILNNCRGEQLQPYLVEIPCDPFRHTPYIYVRFEGDRCKGYRVLTSLEDDQDPAIGEAGCDTACGCGFGADYNYGVSAGIPLLGESCTKVEVPTPSPTTRPSPGGGGSSTPTPRPSLEPSDSYYACAPDGNCNIYYDPIGAGCPSTYPDFATCQAACGNPANWCAE
jgi:type II secretory pathway pseudopilin PulG